MKKKVVSLMLVLSMAWRRECSPDVEVLARIHRKMKQRKTIPRVLFIT